VTLKRWLAALIAGAVWLLSWYAPQSLWVSATLALMAICLLWAAQRSEKTG
jgi:hypothetical protein